MAKREANQEFESALWPELKAYWHPVAFAEDVDPGPLAVQLLDERVVVCRIGGKVRAFRDLCVHRGTPLSLGWVEEENLVCAYHGWSYNTEGNCVRIPSIPPDHPIPKKACLTPFSATERYGLIWVCLAEEPCAPIIDVPWLEDPTYRVFYRQVKTWNTAAGRIIENATDLAHFAWVHEGILGDRSYTGVPEFVVNRNGDTLYYGADFPSGPVHPESHRLNYRLTRPFSIVQQRETPDNQNKVIFITCRPDSGKLSPRFLIVATNFNFDAPEVAHGPFVQREEDIRSGDGSMDGEFPGEVGVTHLIGNQDKGIVETQRPEELPLDLTEELHVKGADSVALVYRRFLRELGVEA